MIEHLLSKHLGTYSDKTQLPVVLWTRFDWHSRPLLFFFFVFCFIFYKKTIRPTEKRLTVTTAKRASGSLRFNFEMCFKPTDEIHRAERICAIGNGRNSCFDWRLNGGRQPRRQPRRPSYKNNVCMVKRKRRRRQNGVKRKQRRGAKCFSSVLFCSSFKFWAPANEATRIRNANGSRSISWYFFKP